MSEELIWPLGGFADCMDTASLDESSTSVSCKCSVHMARLTSISYRLGVN
jgi:hypothetical protein